MKLEFWHTDMIRFLEDASEYGDYYQTLAQKILPFLPPDAHICDAGSGLGYLALALAPHVRKVTAVEKHSNAAAVLEGKCRDLAITNVVSRKGNIDNILPEETYDAMAFCFFGQAQQILKLAKAQCSGQVFVFTRNYTEHRFSAGNHTSNWEGYPQLRELLDRLNIPAHQEFISVEFGQPFRSLEDARRFFDLYSKDSDKSVLTEEFLRQKTRQTGREDFPLYMPHKREIAFIRFQVKDIPSHIG